MAVAIDQDILKKLEEKLGVCQRCGTRQVLCDVMLKKRQLGGKFESGNLEKLCMPCDEDWRAHSAQCDLTRKSTDSDFAQAFLSFLSLPKPEVFGQERALQILRQIAGLRVQTAIEAQRFEGRFRSRARKLDEVYPIGDSYTFNLFQKRADGELNVPDSWLEFLMDQVGEVKTLKTALDREIERQLKYFPVWTLFAEKVPGIGPYLAGFLIAALRDPRNFPDSGHLSGNAGLRIETLKDDRTVAQPRSRGGKLDYDPVLKLVVGVLIPMCLDKRKTTHPDSPYSKLMKEVEEFERRKAEEANPQCCWVRHKDAKGEWVDCGETELVNLGYEDREIKRTRKVDGKTVEEVVGTKRVFLGYCCKKTHGKPKGAHKFLTPGHVLQRIYRKVGRKLMTDFYHVWLYLVGENPRIGQNPRIMYFLNWVEEKKEKDAAGQSESGVAPEEGK